MYPNCNFENRGWGLGGSYRRCWRTNTGLREGGEAMDTVCSNAESHGLCEDRETFA